MLLPETIVAMGITALLMVVVVNFTLFSGRSFAALFNYVDLNDLNKVAIDKLTRDVRQATRVVYCTPTILALEDMDGFSIVYAYSDRLHTLTRIQNGVSRVLLRECDGLVFRMGQRNTIGGSYEVYPTATASTCKVINVSWICSRTIFGSRSNSESVQTARIVIRKQGM